MTVYPLLNDEEIVLHVYQSLLARTKIYYRGEPVDGLQLMSLSETLALDFETIILLDANEEYMPGGGFEQSFIPFDLRSFHHLSMPQDRDGIHAYSFYRLLHCAKNVHFFYSEISADKKGSEESRYILQLRDELARVNPNVLFANETIGTAPMVSGKPMSVCRTAFSCTLDPAPTRISSLSPRSVAPNQTEAPASSTTRPIRLASGATQVSA
jgi:hypothetical protein